MDSGRHRHGATGAAHAPWSVTRTNVSSTDGNWSAQLRAYNGTDAVKVWLERRFELPTTECVTPTQNIPVGGPPAWPIGVIADQAISRSSSSWFSLGTRVQTPKDASPSSSVSGARMKRNART